jgi:hypothetical protein
VFSYKHLLEKTFLEGLGVGDLRRNAINLLVDRGEKVGDLGLFFGARNGK